MDGQNCGTRSATCLNFLVDLLLLLCALQFFGHICRMSDNHLEKTVMLGMTDHKGDQLGGGVTSATGAIAT